MAEVTEQIVREAPDIEAYKLGLLQSSLGTLQGRAGEVPPPYQVAGLTGLEMGAGNVLREGVGGYLPYLTAGAGTTQAGIGAISDTALPLMQQGYGAMQGGIGTMGQAQQLAAQTRGEPYQYRNLGVAGLAGATGKFGVDKFDPRATYDSGGNLVQQSSIMDYYDPYVEDVISAQQADIGRLGKQQRLAANARATAAGAFGGSRGAVEQAEIGRNILGEQSRMGAQLRSQGYQQAREAAMRSFEQEQGRSQQAFEQQQLRRMQAGQGIGQLGLQYGQLGQQDVRDLAALGQSRAAIGQGLGTLGSQAGQLGGQLGALGAQQAQFGALGQQMNLSDANALMQLGGAYRQNQQAQLEAQRMSQREAQMMPYQQLGFLSDIYKGAPSSQYSILTSPTAPGASPFQQIAGLGIAGLGAASGAKYAGLF